MLQLSGDIDQTIHLDTTTRWADRDLGDERELSLRFGRRDRLAIVGYAHEDTMTTGDGITLHITVDATSFSSHDGECTTVFDDITQTPRTEPDGILHIREARGTITCTELTGRHQKDTRTINVDGTFHHRAEHQRAP